SRVGFMKGHGSTTEASNYTFIDKIVSGKLVKYRLKQIDYDGSFTYSRVVEVKLQLVEDYKLCQNYPNPFNPTTTISYTIPENGHVLLEVYNSLGQKAETLVNKTLQAGIHNITWNAQYVPSGVYFYKITVNNFSQTNKMVLMK
ncbi:MAG: T9SS type A sorting domain-containing protein, partial [Ignavibacteriaceae bacterium]